MATCTGDAGSLMDDIVALTNDQGVKTATDEDTMLVLLNQVHRLIAQAGVFEDLTTFNSTASAWEYNLRTLVSDYVKIKSLWWEGEGSTNPYYVEQMPNMVQFLNKRNESVSSSLGYPTFYTVRGNILYVWPTPDETISDAFRIYYCKMPTAMICDAGYSIDDAISDAHRSVYVYGVMWKIFQRSRPSPHAAKFANEYRTLFYDMLNQLISDADNDVVCMVPG